MKKKISALVVSGVMGMAMLLGACAPKEAPFVPETPDAEAPAFANADATLSLTGAIDKSGEANRISSDLFGLFLEDINYASFALDDNLLINSSFENTITAYTGAYGEPTYGWTAGGGASISVTSGQGGVLSDNSDFGNVNDSYLSVSQQGGGTLQNSGHSAVPMAVEQGVGYVFSAFIKGYSGKITLEIRDANTVYASGEVNPSGSGWVKYQTTLTANASADSGLRFVMTFESGGTVCLDNVMLETQDKNEATGIKSYLYDAIAALSPKFFRFPGGCIIEGLDDTSYYDWKNSIGAVAKDGDDTVPAFTYTRNVDGREEEVTTYGEQATRTPNTNLWGYDNVGRRATAYYQMEYGLGFYEYFLLCEELGAKAIPIVNCGLSCMVRTSQPLNGRHGGKIDDFIQDAFDLVAFAKGDPNSSDPDEAYWAQVRVNMGHTEPFEMDYLGIGNEQWGYYYEDYYEKFVEAFTEKAKENSLYGSVRLIVGNCTMFTHCENPNDPDVPNGHRKGAAQTAAEAYVNDDNAAGLYRVADYGVVDQHYYVNYTDLFYHHDLYDGYARPDDSPFGYYDVFVGEYAANTDIVRSPGGENIVYESTNDTANTRFDDGDTSNWLNALAEAAMMTGFERNGDIVKLAAYAPMFGNLRGTRQWAVDMMYYTNTALVRTPSYYVQQLFMQNSGDYKVQSELTFASGSAPTLTFEGSGTRGDASRTVDQIYYVVSADEETGDILIKIVNAGENSVRFNFSLAGMEGIQLADIAGVREVLGYDYTDENALDAENVMAQPAHTIGAFTDGNTFGYEIKALSVTAIRVRTR